MADADYKTEPVVPVCEPMLRMIAIRPEFYSVRKKKREREKKREKKKTAAPTDKCRVASRRRRLIMCIREISMSRYR